MEKQSKILYFLTIITIFISIISAILFSYSAYKIKYLNTIEDKNILLDQKLSAISKEEDELSNKYETQNNTLEKAKKDFKEKYGYEYGQNEFDLINAERESLISRNSLIKDDLEKEIKNFSKYYDGEYYKDKNLGEIYNKIRELKNSKENLNSKLEKNISYKSFLKNAKNSGTIKYLSSLNTDKDIDVFLIMTAIYNKDLYEVGANLGDVDENLNRVYSKIIATGEVFKTLEEFGLNTGNLSYSNYRKLIEKADKLVQEYYKNKGVIEVLESIGDENEKS